MEMYKVNVIEVSSDIFKSKHRDKHVGERRIGGINRVPEDVVSTFLKYDTSNNMTKREILRKTLYIDRENLPVVHVTSIGEAKFITNTGGSQDNQIHKSINVARVKHSRVVGISILDGYIWLQKEKIKMYENGDICILSALCLEEFLNQYPNEQ